MDDWQKIKHLYGRAGFGLRPEQAFHLRQGLDWGAELEAFLHEQAPPPPEYSPETGTRDRAGGMMMGSGKREPTLPVNAAWVGRMAAVERPLLEKMTLFWHGHFACHTKLPHLAAKQLGTLRRHALGNFRDLLNAIARDPSMISYLNNQQNDKRKPNENFARELLELFTIGIGNYTERDIKAAARAFTGWKFNTTEWAFYFSKIQHDYGDKTFMGKTGAFDGGDIIDIILENKETAKFVARKMYRYFVNPQVDERHVGELAEVFYESGYDIVKTMRALLRSDWFYDDHNRGKKIKSPVELLAGLSRAFGLQLPRDLLLRAQWGMGQVLFHPPNVAGWAGGRAWIDNSTLLIRLNLPAELFLKNGGIPANLDLYLQHFQGMDWQEATHELMDCLLPHPRKEVAPLFPERIKGQVDGEKLRIIVHHITTLPEYQLC